MFSSPSSLLRDWRAALLLVAVACLTPERASARCGNHNTIYHELIAAPAQHSAEAQATPAPLTPPCRGPNCSHRPDQDASPPATVTVAPQVSEAALHPGSTQPPAPRSTFARDRSSASP